MLGMQESVGFAGTQKINTSQYPTHNLQRIVTLQRSLLTNLLKNPRTPLRSSQSLPPILLPESWINPEHLHAKSDPLLRNLRQRAPPEELAPPVTNMLKFQSKRLIHNFDARLCL